MELKILEVTTTTVYHSFEGHEEPEIGYFNVYELPDGSIIYPYDNCADAIYSSKEAIEAPRSLDEIVSIEDTGEILHLSEEEVLEIAVRSYREYEGNHGNFIEFSKNLSIARYILEKEIAELSEEDTNIHEIIVEINLKNGNTTSCTGAGYPEADFHGYLFSNGSIINIEYHNYNCSYSAGDSFYITPPLIVENMEEIKAEFPAPVFDVAANYTREKTIEEKEDEYIAMLEAEEAAKAAGFPVRTFVIVDDEDEYEDEYEEIIEKEFKTDISETVIGDIEKKKICPMNIDIIETIIDAIAYEDFKPYMRKLLAIALYPYE